MIRHCATRSKCAWFSSYRAGGIWPLASSSMVFHGCAKRRTWIMHVTQPCRVHRKLISAAPLGLVFVLLCPGLCHFHTCLYRSSLPDSPLHCVSGGSYLRCTGEAQVKPHSSKRPSLPSLISSQSHPNFSGYHLLLSP